MIGTLADDLRELGVERHDRDDRAPIADTSSAAAAAPDGWPDPPTPEAYYGLAGDIVRAIEPHTEADPVALLGHVLIGFGSLIGRRAHYLVEDTEHHTNEFAVLIGRSSKGRKGTSESRIRRVLRCVDPEWERDRVVSGLSSGEGLIEAVRDPSEKRTNEGEPVDPGVQDKRLLVVESEWASTLRVLEREGNRLSPLIRTAWDHGNLQSLTKASPGRATGAHVAIIGHVTADELRRYLNRTEIGNGFGNRFLYLCVRRARLLPRGGGAPDLGALISRLHDAVDHGRKAGVLDMDEPTQAVWAGVYPELSRERDGLAGALTNRAEAHVVRLALLYALLDRSTAICLPHLEAALALWGFAERSAVYVWGDSMGDPLADEIASALRDRTAGMTRTEIRDLLGRHARGDRIDAALTLLKSRGRARVETVATGGRSAERWLYVVTTELSR